MRLFPPELEIGDYEGFTPEKDFFQREKFGEGLGNLFANVDDPMVAILDAPWGSGKTTFIKMWCGYMRNRGFPVIYFDAFKNDYTDDAFLALAGEVIALADELGSKNGVARKDYLLKTKRVAWAFAKGGLKKGLGKILGEEGVNDVVAAATEEGGNCLLESFDAYLKEKLEGRKKERDAFNEFGKALAVLAEELSKTMQAKREQENAKDGTEQGEAESETPRSTTRPLIFVIDELDRCKPPFALDLLEKIKHFFSVPHVHFLLVTHMEQLENSVRYAYGMKEQANIYLQKFYNLVFSFPANEPVQGTSHPERYIGKMFSELFDTASDKNLKNELCKILKNYSKQNRITLRSLEKITTYIGVFFASTDNCNIESSPIIATLCIMRILAPNLYRKAQSKTLLLDEVLKFMAFGRENDPTSKELFETCWGYCIGDDEYYEKHEGNIKKLQRLLPFTERNNRASIVPHCCTLLEKLAIKDSQ